MSWGPLAAGLVCWALPAAAQESGSQPPPAAIQPLPPGALPVPTKNQMPNITLPPGAVPIPLQVGQQTAMAGASKEPPVECTTSQQCAEKKGYGEVCVTEKCQEYEDARDLFEMVGLNSSKEEVPKAFVPHVAVFPVIGYSPPNGFLIGASGTIGMYLGNPATTTISNVTANAYYTAKGQVILDAALVALTADNEWELQGDYRFLIYNQPTYGLSTGSTATFNGITIGGQGDTSEGSVAQPINFDLVRIHQYVLKKVHGAFYAGGAYLLDSYWNIVDHNLNVAATPPDITSHYAYSQLNGFNPTSYAVSGLGLDLLFDNRDSTINAYRGFYGNLVFSGNPTWLGSSAGSTLLFGEFRTYIPLSDNVPRNVIALWFYSQGVTSGAIPYLALPAVAWDLMGTTGRGYVQGRWRGTAEMYGEAEWRFRLTNDGVLGGVVFVNAETYSRPEATYMGTISPAVNLFQYVRPAGGIGLRIGMNRQARINLRVDIAMGYNSGGLFIGTGEAF
jgi:hypothetical protein